MSHIIAVAQPKGGVGKTTLTVSVAAELHRRGKTVALVDADPQRSACQWAEPGNLQFPVYEIALTDQHVLNWNREIIHVAANYPYVVVDTAPNVQAVAPSLGVELSAVDVRDAGEIERAVTAFARSSNGGLIVTASALATRHRDLIIALAARLRLPAVYPYRFFVTVGGLISYGPDFVEQYRQAAGYFDRILKGEKPADMPVQAPTK
jgi:GTPase SAR1 family protein